MLIMINKKQLADLNPFNVIEQTITNCHKHLSEARMRTHTHVRTQMIDANIQTCLYWSGHL